MRAFFSSRFSPVLTLVFTLLLALPAHQARGATPVKTAKPATKTAVGKGKKVASRPAKRNLANKGPSRVLTLVCRDGEGGPENVIGLASMSPDLDNPRGTFGMQLYVRTENGYTPKALNGTYSNVPNGFIFNTRWKNAQGGDFTLLHVHPREKTDIPGLAGKQSCEIAGQLESL